MNKPVSNPLDALLATLYNRINYERQSKITPRSFKLQNMREFLRRLGDPHLACPTIHVAGTKGKGSVATMIGQVLTAARRKTGVYVSPHLETINQRMLLDGFEISDEQLYDVLKRIEPVAEAMDQEADEDERRPLTFFEVTTAAAFCFFAEQQCDAVVLEVGLGGRLDSTNVCQPLVSVITNISFDHMRQLGNTLALIAGEKAGIIKPGVPVVSGVLAEEAAEVIESVARENQAPLFQLNRDFFVAAKVSNIAEEVEPIAKEDAVSPAISQSDILSCPFTITGQVNDENFSIDNVSLKMLGPHQRTNAAIAATAVKLFNQQSTAQPSVSDTAIRAGLATAAIAGRTEIVANRPTIMLDIAHNVASVGALVVTLQQLPQWQSASKKILIFSSSREKDEAGMLRPLLAQFDQIIFTKYQNNPRGREAVELLEIAEILLTENQTDTESKTQTHVDNRELGCAVVTLNKRVPDLLINELPESALATALSSASEDDFICIAGSAFLVAELRALSSNAGTRR